MSSEEFENQYGLPNDNDSMNHHGNGMGFGVMPQHQHGGGDSGEISQGHGDAHQHHDQNQQQGQSASDTAAAAMAQYHTMTVPQSTEQAFMNHATDHSNERPTSSSMDPSVVGAHQRNNSFGDFDISGVKDAMTPSNGAGSPTQGGKNQTTPKPQVGTEEWHKVRRDNHKEG
jgi:bHLH factor